LIISLVNLALLSCAGLLGMCDMLQTYKISLVAIVIFITRMDNIHTYPNGDGVPVFIALVSQTTYLVLVAVLWVFINSSTSPPDWIASNSLPINCILIAMMGGVLYCLRAIYLNKCVRKAWDADWNIWYVIRPITSAISGIAAYLFLNAGLLILESDQQATGSQAGYLALAFIAGLNVDKFVQKLEEVAKATFGIEKSNASSNKGSK